MTRLKAALATLLLALSVTLSGATGSTPASAGTPMTFRIATYNVLGDIHTAPYTHDDRFAPSRIRAEWMGDAFRLLSDPDIVGMQEVDKGQFESIMRATSGHYAAWPGTQLSDAGSVQQSLIWRSSVWEATAKQTISIPFVKGSQRKQPVVRLKHRATGREIWVINVHNAPRDLQAERDEDVKIEIAKIKELRATGLPVFLVGDMNEKKTVFCKVVGQTDLVSPIGGSATTTTCNPPTGMRVDWIFGSNDVTFDTFAMVRGPLVARSTDHHVPISKVTIP
jgi:endonuclease/exonuclease/phosphatase family metal-dependent hydrolase